MYLKKATCLVLTAGIICASFATKARVISMGRTDNFYMDDISIFRNPANVNVFPNMLMGDLGVYRATDTLAQENYLDREWNPINPYFGGILSYSLNQTTEAAEQFPMLSIGAVFNRYDDRLDYINPETERFRKVFPEYADAQLPEPLGKVDLMVGYALKNGGMIGVGGYLAFQEFEADTIDEPLESRLYQGNVGINWPVAKTMNLEISLGTSQLTGLGLVVDAEDGEAEPVTISDDQISFRGDVRLFSALATLNGDFVPHLGVDVINLEENRTLIDVAGGIGINLNIDRGFFWSALEGIYREDQGIDQQELGGRVSFGLERNIIFDWLVWRIGGTKSLIYQTSSNDDGQWIQNPESTGSDDDLIGFGMGINIENRFKVDAVVNENVFYTFTNLFSGNDLDNIFTRFSATYSF